MKWREVRNPTQWYRGPDEGRTIYKAKKNGVEYRVQAYYEGLVDHRGAVAWWSFTSKGVNKRWWTKEEAIAWCEKEANW